MGKPQLIKEIIKNYNIMEFINSDKMQFTRDLTDAFSKHFDYIIKIAGVKYQMTPEIKKIIYGMLYYFNGNKESEKYGLSITKGIALLGTYGTGKTTIFALFHEYLKKIAQINNFRITSIDEIVESIYSDNNYLNSVYIYNTQPNINNEIIKKPIHLLINEFGVQYNIKKYGSNVNDIVDLFMMRRYEIFQQYKKVTHITSNYGTDDFEKIFPARLIDRFKEMFNILILDGKSFRK